MPTDQLLHTLLHRLQDPPDLSQTEAFLGTTAHLLATLSNPLNLGVLTAQFLGAPAIWHHGPEGTLHDDLHTCLRVVTVYNTGANRVRAAVRDNNYYEDIHDGANPDGTVVVVDAQERWLQEQALAKAQGKPLMKRIGCDVWAKGVAAGLDARSRRWQHLLVLTGLLLGMETDGGVVQPGFRGGLSPATRAMLEEAVVRAANLSLETETPATDGPVSGAAVVLALSYALPLLAPHNLAQLNYDALLPLAIWAITDAPTFQQGAFLAPIADEVPRTHAVPGIHWAVASPSFQNVARLASSPLVNALGFASKLAGHAAQHVRDPRAVVSAQASLVEFTGGLLTHWHGLALATVDPGEEHAVLSPETLEATAPALWDLLKKVMYSVVAVLQAVTARCLEDRMLARDFRVSYATLKALRNLYFISSRGGSSQFTVYTFTYLAAIDMLSRFPPHCETFLRDIAPNAAGTIPPHATDRTLDLFYLNLVEHLPLTLSPPACDQLIIRPALTYLNPPVAEEQGPGGLLAASPLTAELLESSHSVVLAALSVPGNAALAADLVPFYADTLSAAFPSRISPRQFRLALRTVIRITSPPFPASASHPDLAEALLEMVRFRALHANQTPLPPSPREAAAAAAGEEPPIPPTPFSEQSTLVIALVDALPSLPLRLVEEWLTITAELLGAIQDPVLREPIRARFWDVLVNGEMDVDRAVMGVMWWGRGGRELVLRGGGPQEPPMMSGALPVVQRDSRL